MLNKKAKPLLVLTSMAPVLVAYGINALSNGKSIYYGFLFVSAIGMVAICILVLTFAKKELPIAKINIKSIKSSDKEVMTFLLAYLLPLMPENTIGIGEKNIVTTIFIFSMFFLAIYHSNAFDFNPLLGILGYHFYEVQDEDGMAFLLITKEYITKTNEVTNVVQLFPNTFLNVEVKSNVKQ